MVQQHPRAKDTRMMAAAIFVENEMGAPHHMEDQLGVVAHRYQLQGRFSHDTDPDAQVHFENDNGLVIFTRRGGYASHPPRADNADLYMHYRRRNK